MWAGGKGLAFSKPTGGVRICVPWVIHRLVGRILAKPLNSIVRATTAPFQLGIGQKAGREAAIHMQRALQDSDPDNCAIQIGHRQRLLQRQARHHFPARNNCLLKKFLPLLKTIYPTDNSAGPIIQYNDETMTVKEGIAQGCPLSPALFSLALHDPLQKAAQETDVHPTAYIDDVRATAPVAKLEQFLTSLNTHLPHRASRSPSTRAPSSSPSPSTMTPSTTSTATTPASPPSRRPPPQSTSTPSLAPTTTSSRTK